MGPFVVKWTHDPSLRRTARKKKRLQTSFDRFCDGDSPLFHCFSPLNPGAGHSGNRNLCCRIRLCDRRSHAPAKRVEEFSRTVKLFYLFLIFLSGLMLLPAITGWISTLLHLSGIVKLSIGLYWK